MAAHTSTWDEPITADYRGVTLYECPPNGQGLAAIIAVNLAAGFDLAGMNEADRTHIMLECMRIGFADAQQWVCDPRVSKIPLPQLASRAYADSRRSEIRPDAGRACDVPFGDPMAGSDTVYLTTVDGEGNVCSFINSLYRAPAAGWSFREPASACRTGPRSSSWIRSTPTLWRPTNAPTRPSSRP